MGSQSYSTCNTATLINAKNNCLDRIKQNAQTAINNLDPESQNYKKFLEDIEYDRRKSISKVDSIFLTLSKSANYLPEGILNSPSSLSTLSEEKFNSLLSQAEASKEAYENRESGNNFATQPLADKSEKAAPRNVAPTGFTSDTRLAFKSIFEH